MAMQGTVGNNTLFQASRCCYVTFGLLGKGGGGQGSRVVVEVMLDRQQGGYGASTFADPLQPLDVLPLKVNAGGNLIWSELCFFKLAEGSVEDFQFPAQNNQFMYGLLKSQA